MAEWRKWHNSVGLCEMNAARGIQLRRTSFQPSRSSAESAGSSAESGRGGRWYRKVCEGGAVELPGFLNSACFDISSGRDCAISEAVWLYHFMIRPYQPALSPALFFFLGYGFFSPFPSCLFSRLFSPRAASRFSEFFVWLYSKFFFFFNTTPRKGPRKEPRRGEEGTGRSRYGAKAGHGHVKIGIF